jgi:hypothetical protein
MTQDEVNELILQKELSDENIPQGWKMDNSEPGPKSGLAENEKNADLAFAFVQIGKKNNANNSEEIIPY